MQKSFIAFLALTLTSWGAYRYFTYEQHPLDRISGNDLETRVAFFDLETHIKKRFGFAEVSIDKYKLEDQARILIEVTTEKPAEREIQKMHALIAASEVYGAESAKEVTHFQVLVYRTLNCPDCDESLLSITFEPKHLMKQTASHQSSTATAP